LRKPAFHQQLVRTHPFFATAHGSISGRPTGVAPRGVRCSFVMGLEPSLRF
jgi:hypothetical protein